MTKRDKDALFRGLFLLLAFSPFIINMLYVDKALKHYVLHGETGISIVLFIISFVLNYIFTLFMFSFLITKTMALKDLDMFLNSLKNFKIHIACAVINILISIGKIVGFLKMIDTLGGPLPGS